MRPLHVIVVAKPVRTERMVESLDIFDFELTDAEMAGIASLDTGASLFFDHRDPQVVSRLGNRNTN